MSADCESIKFTIEHIIESNNYTNEEIMELLTNISEYCEAKITEFSSDGESEEDNESSIEDESSEGDSEDYEEDGEEDEEPVNDYPFKTWSAYSNALTESLSTEFYNETYPEYYKALHESDVDDYSIVVDLVELCDQSPQAILHGFIDILCNAGKRYGREMLDYKEGSSDIIDYLLSKGAKMNSNMVFNWHGYDSKDDIAGNEIRASLIDYYFPKLGLTANEYNRIRAIDDVYAALEECDMNNPDACMEIIEGDLKFKSKFLSIL